MPNLGLGLNLNQQRQKALQQAVSSGNTGQFFNQNQGLARRIGRLETGGPSKRLDRWNALNTAAGNAPLASGPGNPAAATMNAESQANLDAFHKGGHASNLPPGGSPTTGTGKNAAPPPATPPPAETPPPAAPTYQGTLNTQFGAGQPFGMQDWYGGNPLETARDLSRRELDKSLAGIRARYAASGGGTSGREAVAEGTAAGEATTGLGDVMAQRGLQARQADVMAGLQAMLGSGQQQLQGQALQQQWAQGMSGLGNVLNQVGAMEQGVPNANAIMQLLGLFSQSTGKSKTKQTQQTQSGFLGM